MQAVHNGREGHFVVHFIYLKDFTIEPCYEVPQGFYFDFLHIEEIRGKFSLSLASYKMPYKELI